MEMKCTEMDRLLSLSRGKDCNGDMGSAEGSWRRTFVVDNSRMVADSSRMKAVGRWMRTAEVTWRTPAAEVVEDSWTMDVAADSMKKLEEVEEAVEVELRCSLAAEGGRRLFGRVAGLGVGTAESSTLATGWRYPAVAYSAGKGYADHSAWEVCPSGSAAKRNLLGEEDDASSFAVRGLVVRSRMARQSWVT